MEEDGYFLPSDILDPTSSSAEADFLGGALLEELGGSGSVSHGAAAAASSEANATVPAGAAAAAADDVGISLASYATSQISAAAASIPLSVEGTNPMAKAFTPTRPIPPRGPPPGLSGPPPTPPAPIGLAIGLSPLRGIGSGSGSASDGALSGFSLALGSDAAPRPLGPFVASPLRNTGVGSLDSGGSGAAAGGRGVAVGPLLGLQDGALSPGSFFGGLSASPEPGRSTMSPPPGLGDRALDKGVPPAKAPFMAPHWEQPQPSQLRQPPSPLRAASLSATPPRGTAAATLRQQQQQQLGGVRQRPLLPPQQPHQPSSPQPPQQQQQQQAWQGRNKNGVAGQQQQQQTALAPAQAQQAWLPGVLAAASRAAPQPTNGSGSSGVAALKPPAASETTAAVAVAATAHENTHKAGVKGSKGQGSPVGPQGAWGSAAASAAAAAAAAPGPGGAAVAAAAAAIAARAGNGPSAEADIDVIAGSTATSSAISSSATSSTAVSSGTASSAATGLRTGKAPAAAAKGAAGAAPAGKHSDAGKGNHAASSMRPRPAAKGSRAGGKSASPEIAEVCDQRLVSEASGGSGQDTSKGGDGSSKGSAGHATAKAGGHEDSMADSIAALRREREGSAVKGRKASRESSRHAATKSSRERGGRSNLKASNVLSFSFSPSSVLAAGGAMVLWMAATAGNGVRTAFLRTRLMQRSGALLSAFLQLFGALLSLLLCLVGLVLAVCFAGFWVALRVHKCAARELFCHAHVPLSFVMPYTFPRVARLFAEIEWAPHWVPICLWYSFLGQFLLAPGPAPAASGVGGSDGSGSSGTGRLWRRALRMLLPVALLWEGAEGRSLLMDLHGGELLLLSFALAALRAGALSSPVFLTSWSAQALAVSMWGPSAYMDYYQAVLSLASLRAISAVDLMRNGGKYDARYRASVCLTDGFRLVRATSTSTGVAGAGSGSGGVSSLFTGSDGAGGAVAGNRSMVGA